MVVIKLHPPPGITPTLPTPSNPRPPGTPAELIDALAVRAEVFVEEQGCSAENEVDDDDARSWHWVVYSADGNTTSSEADQPKPIGTIRLVPPHPRPRPHPDGDGDGDGEGPGREPYIKLTRLAVVRSLRGHGIGRHLVETAVEWARAHPDEINGAFQGCPCPSLSAAHVPVPVPVPGPGMPGSWNGWVLVHAQVDVERMYTRLGFERDEGMGRWLEEGIEHIGMWRYANTE